MVYISKKYKTKLRGKKTQIQNRCPHCGLDLRMFDFDYGDMYDNAIGFHDQLMIVECPKCFEYFYFHIGGSEYELFLQSIKNGDQIHYK